MFANDVVAKNYKGSLTRQKMMKAYSYTSFREEPQLGEKLKRAPKQIYEMTGKNKNYAAL